MSEFPHGAAIKKKKKPVIEVLSPPMYLNGGTLIPDPSMRE